MKLHPSLACLAVAVPIMVAPMFSFADGPIDGTLYGKINLSLDKVEFDDSVGVLTPLDEWQLNSNASRFGFVGETKIDDSLNVIYQIEWEVDIDSDGTDLGPRNRYIGLSGSFGSVLAGRHDTPTKLTQNKIDLFNDYFGDIKTTFEGENRSPNIAMYSTPEISAFSGGTVSGKLAFIPGEDSAGGNNGINDGISASAALEIDELSLYLSLGIDRDVDGQDLERIVAQWTFGDFVFGGMYQQNEDELNTIDESGIFASAAYTLGNNVFKVQVGQLDNDAGAGTFEKENTFSLGADHKLGNNTKLFTYLTRNVDTAGGNTEEELTVLGAGIEHKF